MNLHALRHYHLKVARLPISPPGLVPFDVGGIIRAKWFFVKRHEPATPAGPGGGRAGPARAPTPGGVWAKNDLWYHSGASCFGATERLWRAESIVPLVGPAAPGGVDLWS